MVDGRSGKRFRARLLWPLVGLAVLGLSAGDGGPHVIPSPAVVPKNVPAPAATELVEVSAHSSGTVARVLVSPRQHVTAGSLLVELDSTAYRGALARARRRDDAARARVAGARSQLALRERAVRSAVQAALETVPRPEAHVTSTRVAAPPSNDGSAAALERARAQLIAAQAGIVRAAEGKLEATQRAMERDQTLLGQGMISAREVEADSAAYQSALAQARAAAASLRGAQADGSGAAGHGRPGRPASAGLEDAQRAVATAQNALQTAQAELPAARQAVDRDTALLAEGAIPAQQLNTDTLAYEAVRARVAAAEASLQQAQLQLEAARRAQQRLRNTAASARVPAARPDVSRAEGLVRRAQARIVEAQQAARQLGAAQAGLVNADLAVRAAELDLDGSLVRAPVEGWVAGSVANNGGEVRPGQLLMWLAAPRQAAIRLRQLRAESQHPGPDTRARLTRISTEESQALTRLDAESQRIRTIVLGASGADHLGPVPALLGAAFHRPVWGEITSGYGWRIHPIFQKPEFHTGIDIAAPWGTPIEAPADGRVIFAGQMPANGLLLILDHGNGFSTTYSHLSSYAVRTGERVRRGQIIARVGSTGWSTGPHLFFEVREGGRPVNPLEQ